MRVYVHLCMLAAEHPGKFSTVHGRTDALTHAHKLTDAEADERGR